MTLELLDQQLIASIQGGLELTSKPFAAIAAKLGISEQKVLNRLQQLKDDGTIKRLGVVVKHRELGFKANAMVVWDIPDDQVADIAQRIAAYDCVTLCYQRPRRLPQWSYNLFSMIHGKDRESVLKRLEELVIQLDLQAIEHTALFSTKCFKQRGARYINPDKIISSTLPPLSLLTNKGKLSIPAVTSTKSDEFIIPAVITHAYG